MAKITVVAVLGSALFLAGCVSSPVQYETRPVQLETPKGIVTCQLYTDDIVLWDRAIDRPETMTVREADQYCREEGQRRLAAPADRPS